jgi:putative transposase
MKHLGQRYVQYINRTYRRSGTLWEGRFRSCLTQSEDYVLSCYRYIELNPVRANMANHPRDYRWSSYGMNGKGEPDRVVTTHEEYLRIGRIAYCDLFRAHLDAERIQEIRKATNGNYALGNERFKAEVEQALRRRATPGKSGRPVRAT